MEFPPDNYDVFEAEQFDTARARTAGDAVMEVMMQMRPSGRCVDHFRIGLDGRILETKVKATNVFRAPVLSKYVLNYQMYPLCHLLQNYQLLLKNHYLKINQKYRLYQSILKTH